MTRVDEIEQAVLRLTPAELDAFRTWFADFEAKTWDKQTKEDAEAARLDALADEVFAEYRS